MKFILSILALLAIAFLVGCSAKDTSNNNKLSNSEIAKLGKKYGGVYVFNKKFEKEIDDRERERKEAIKELKGRDLGGGLYAVDTKPVDQKFPQTLSNGKKYYTTYIDYERASKKILPNISSFYEDKIKRITGEEAYKYASVLPLYLYMDDNNEPVYISMSVSYSYKTKKYGFFGDEGRGFALSRDEIRYTKGGNKFYIEDLEKQ
ncbi:tRNA 2-selenouridine synthase [Campylobacter showae]|uniref:tRNA 2-selenouridine synthase n=1 Tax=Campylobacter showae TaxID=204 RepID=UPI0026EEF5B7|nr:tRNA 2-selenouridine synthase [Campylobacter showae]